MKNNKTKEKLVGIKGWLLLIVIGLFLEIIVYLAGILDFFFFKLNIYFGLIYLILFCLLIKTLILILQKKKKAIMWAIVMLWVPYIFGLVIFTLEYMQFGQTNYNAIVGMLIGNIIWTLYFKKSERVKNTLTR